MAAQMSDWGRRTRGMVRRRLQGAGWLSAIPRAARDVREAFRDRDGKHRWRRSRLRSLRAGIGWSLALALLGIAFLSSLTVLWTLVFDTPFLGFTMKGVQKRCDTTGFACGIAISILFTVGPLLLGSFLFVFLRLRLVRRPLVKEAKEHPEELVQTAGEIVGKVIGREDVCNVIQDDLSDRKSRRPHVIVGGVGVGKTAVLVRLTELLAQRGAVPVPVRMRDATTDIDFFEMARASFLRATQSSHWLAAEAERGWDRLCQMDKVVIVADGLEEALADDKDLDRERDHRVRLAVSQARKRRYPLVIASRAHDALSALDAALLRLEPLSHEAAVEYIAEAAPVEDERLLERIVENGEVVDAPLYMQIARELHENGQLRGDTIDAGVTDRVLLRMNLMRCWLEALIGGKLDRTARVPINPDQRRATVVQLAALACSGLANDTLEPTFDMYEVPSGTPGGRARAVYSTLCKATRDGVRKAVGLPVDMPVAATNGVRLKLVEPRKNGVRFPHSIMQAYLASTLIGEALKHVPVKGPSFTDRALTLPGRELLIALVMFSRRPEAALPGPGHHRSWRSWLCERLLAAARRQNAPDAKVFELLAAAVEVDSVDGDSPHEEAAKALVERWRAIRARDDAIRDAKLVAVSRLGDAARALGQGSLYRRLYEICCAEESYPIRLAAAQEIGLGGERAFAELKDAFPRVDAKALRDSTKRREEEREYIVQAWLLPMLVGSVDRAGRERDAAGRLEQWMELVGKRMPLSIEAALAQGFKYAANRRPQHPYESADTRSYLAARAAEMLEKAEYWFSRLTLLHALTLWALSGTLHRPRGVEDRRDFEAIVARWLERDSGGVQHPFVTEASKLAVRALKKGQPERYIWIDESGVATTVGSRPKRETPRGMRRLWIPPSAGWLVLDRRAQQLVADVLILLTLAERGAESEDSAANLRKINKSRLPHCLTAERCAHLRPTETAGVTQRPPSDTCKGGCPVLLCPYPPKGEQPFRVELGEAFCRHQQTLLRRTLTAPMGHRAEWQNATRRELKSFWRQMEDRART